ncbi:MAG: hypothetical protein H7318_14520 [Oligoflexus sp.]|nr:hypothetical protein [Oligoflexus sp.]
MISAQGTTTEILQDSDFPKLKAFVINATGLSYFDKKDEDLAGRVALRFAAIGQMTCADYLLQLNSSTSAGSEFDQLVLALTIGETYFFRHSEQFKALKELIIPELIKENQNKRTLNIWCAGCSTGAEPYSVSILLKQHFKSQLSGWTVQIYGTDINRSYLSRASSGRFNTWHLRSLSEAEKKLYFEENEQAWDLHEELKTDVSFHFHNLITSHYPPVLNGPEQFDVILCRNVMIYFNQETIASILPQFNKCLSSIGWLLLGYSEINIDLYKSFDLVNFPGAMLVKKKSAASVARQEPASALPDTRPVPLSLRTPTLLSPTKSQIPTRLQPLAPTEAQLKNLYESARQMADLGDLNGSLSAIDKLLQQEQLDARAHFLRGVLLYQMALNPQAEESLRKAIYLDRDFILAHYQLGLVYHRLQQSDKAQHYFNNTKSLLFAVPSESILFEGNGMTACSLLSVLNIIEKEG